MSEDGDKKPEGSEQARNLFGHKSGAQAWEEAPNVEAVPTPSVPKVSRPTEPAETSSAPYPRDASYTPRPAEEAQTGLVLADLDDEGELTKLHPNYKLLMRIGALVLAAIIVIISLVVEAALGSNTGLPFGLVFGPAVLLAAFVAIRVPLARYNAKGYQISSDRLRVVRGIMFHSDTIVPFGRVQHIDVDQGPIERALGIATLTLHTAGSHNASVRLPGLGHELAVEMREAIRAHIKRETL